MELYGLCCVYILAYAYSLPPPLSALKKKIMNSTVFYIIIAILAISRRSQYKAFYVVRMDGSKSFQRSITKKQELDTSFMKV